MNNLKRFKTFRLMNENVENDMDIKDHVSKIMNALYGMDEKYEDQVSTSYNEKAQEIKIKLDDFNEVSNVLDYLRGENYNASALSDDEILITL